eukprot:366350-Chlamydomonas_euryale.AAC.12
MSRSKGGRGKEMGVKPSLRRDKECACDVEVVQRQPREREMWGKLCTRPIPLFARVSLTHSPVRVHLTHPFPSSRASHSSIPQPACVSFIHSTARVRLIHPFPSSRASDSSVPLSSLCQSATVASTRKTQSMPKGSHTLAGISTSDPPPNPISLLTSPLWSAPKSEDAQLPLAAHRPAACPPTARLTTACPSNTPSW